MWFTIGMTITSLIVLSIALILDRKILRCKYKGHNWDYYSVSTGYGSNEIEQAGKCTRCGFDTHGEYDN